MAIIEPGECTSTKVNLCSKSTTRNILEPGSTTATLPDATALASHSKSFFFLLEHILAISTVPQGMFGKRPGITLQKAKITNIINATQAKFEKVHKHETIHKI
jgi:hypothetical protein